MSEKAISQIGIICLESEAFYSLIDEVVDRLKEQHKEQDIWIDDVQAMKELNIKSKTTLQRLRDTGSIRFSQPVKRIILYDRRSILSYLEKHAQETFQ